MTEKSLKFSKQTALSLKATRDLREGAIAFLLFLAAFSSVATTVAILIILVSESVGFFQKVSLVEFLTSKEWTPLFSEPHYGILPLVSGTLVITGVSMAVAIPLGTIIAIYLSEFASNRLREVIKPVLELLAGIPTVVYGYFAFLFVTPLLQKVLPDLPGFNMLSPGLVVGVMIIPFISSIGEDAMRSVPLYLREGAYAMGATRFYTATSVVFPAAFSGISSAYILAISRAIGLTMVPAIAAGMQPNYTWNPMEPGATIAAYIVQVSLGDLPHASIEYQTIFVAGLTLVLMTLVFNIVGHFLSKRYREIY